MSGILAVFGRNGQPVDASTVETMLEASPHSARNGQLVWLDGKIALAHQHFWITPEEVDEQQPIVAAGGCRAITCDARLDNRTELISALGLENTTGKGPRDAELILRAYERWGTDCVDHLLGDFAFAIWDAERQELFAARDALGTRGVCYYLDRRLAIVGSEISHILAHPAVQPRMNEGRVAEFLAGLWDNHEETFYDGILYCPPAHCLLVKAGSWRRWRYWDIDPEFRIRYRQDGEYAEHYLSLLTEAVRCRLRCAGPVGISLSGGLDSSAVAALAASLAPQAGLPQQRLKSFSYVFDELQSCDEREYIQPLVDRYHLEATYLLCDDKWTLRDLPSWPVDRAFVLSDPYAWLPEAVREAAQQAGCRMLLSGSYGDVLFTGGYYWALDMLREFRLVDLALTIMGHLPEIKWRRDIFEYGLRQLTPQTVVRAYRRRRPRRVELMHPGLEPSLVERADLRERTASHQAQRRFSTPGQWSRYRSLTLNVFSQGAAATRKFYNAHGLEIATPYWDRRLVEYVMALPGEQLGRPHLDRWVHRNAMAGLLPGSIRWRVGRTVFVPLLDKGLFEKERATLALILENPQVVQRRMVRREWLQGKLQNCSVQSQDFFLFWLCISLELWLRRWW